MCSANQACDLFEQLDRIVEAAVDEVDRLARRGSPAAAPRILRVIFGGYPIGLRTVILRSLLRSGAIMRCHSYVREQTSHFATFSIEAAHPPPGSSRSRVKTRFHDPTARIAGERPPAPEACQPAAHLRDGGAAVEPQNAARDLRRQRSRHVRLVRTGGAHQDHLPGARVGSRHGGDPRSRRAASQNDPHLHPAPLERRLANARGRFRPARGRAGGHLGRPGQGRANS